VRVGIAGESGHEAGTDGVSRRKRPPSKRDVENGSEPVDDAYDALRVMESLVPASFGGLEQVVFDLAVGREGGEEQPWYLRCAIVRCPSSDGCGAPGPDSVVERASATLFRR